MQPKEHYQKQSKKAKETSLMLKKKIRTNSLLRLGGFLGTLGALFGLISISPPLATFLSIAFFASFLFLVRLHVQLQKKHRYWTAREEIAQTELAALEHDFSSFDEGKQFINTEHNYSYDLDIFGRSSVFQMLNRTITQHGSSKLASMLGKEDTNTQQIKQKQKSIKELSGKPELMEHFRAVGKSGKNEALNLDELKTWGESRPEFIQSFIIKIIAYLMPAISVGCLAMGFFDSLYFKLFPFFFISNFFIVGRYLKQTIREHNALSTYSEMLNNYSLLLAVIEDSQFNSPSLKNIQQSIRIQGVLASSVLKKLSKIVGMMDSRLNIVAAIFLEGFLLWDLHCLLKLSRWKKKYAADLPNWFAQLGLFDYYTSIGTFAFNNPDYAYPELLKEGGFIGKELGHPLIPKSEMVANDVKLAQDGFVIITGANMSGKSTFLRTLAVNMILGMQGAPVCAQSMSYQPRKLFSSMRTSDSLEAHESYFYAELKRLKALLDMLKTGESPFIILDEILKGTNSVDKQKGSWAALEKILSLKGTGVIATHDLALTKIEEENKGRVQNKCFEIEIDNASIQFDYKLQDGVTQKMNANLLMKQMGIID